MYNKLIGILKNWIEKRLLKKVKITDEEVGNLQDIVVSFLYFMRYTTVENKDLDNRFSSDVLSNRFNKQVFVKGTAEYNNILKNKELAEALGKTGKYVTREEDDFDMFQKTQDVYIKKRDNIEKYFQVFPRGNICALLEPGVRADLILTEEDLSKYRYENFGNKIILYKKSPIKHGKVWPVVYTKVGPTYVRKDLYDIGQYDYAKDIWENQTHYYLMNLKTGENEIEGLIDKLPIWKGVRMSLAHLNIYKYEINLGKDSRKGRVIKVDDNKILIIPETIYYYLFMYGSTEFEEYATSFKIFFFPMDFSNPTKEQLEAYLDRCKIIEINSSVRVSKLEMASIIRDVNDDYYKTKNREEYTMYLANKLNNYYNTIDVKSYNVKNKEYICNLIKSKMDQYKFRGFAEIGYTIRFLSESF